MAWKASPLYPRKQLKEHALGLPRTRIIHLIPLKTDEPTQVEFFLGPTQKAHLPPIPMMITS